MLSLDHLAILNTEGIDIRMAKASERHYLYNRTKPRP